VGGERRTTLVSGPFPGTDRGNGEPSRLSRPEELAIATIAFFIEHEEGHLNPTFRLARRLAVRGHRVVYLGLADGAEFVRGQGFEFVTILAGTFPRGTLRTLREKAREEGAAGAGGRGAEIGDASRPGPESAYARTWRGLLDGGADLDRAVRGVQPDLFVLTGGFVPHALVLRALFRRPVALLTLSLRTVPKSEYAMAMGRLLMHAGPAQERFAALLAAADPPPQGAAPAAARLAPRLLAQVLRMRELIFCPSELELPGRSWEREPEVFYVEPNIDLERRTEGAFPWEALDPSRRLLYASLGSQSYWMGREKATAFLGAVAAAFAERPGWQVVLSTGGLLGEGEIPVSPGTVVTAWAPQLDLLDRTAVAVTHGGLGTVKECIVRGVPMVVFPVINDQPDNARRIVHHGLGASGDLGSFSAASIAALVEQADRPAVRDNVERMRQTFRAVEDSGIGVRRIEELLSPQGGEAAGRPQPLTPPGA
jgi:zeaxanthin glucosyltransferase